MGRAVRKLVRLAVGAGLVAGAVAAVRAALGRAAGEPGVPARQGTPMSLDRWPAVPQAPARRES